MWLLSLFLKFCKKENEKSREASRKLIYHLETTLACQKERRTKPLQHLVCEREFIGKNFHFSNRQKKFYTRGIEMREEWTVQFRV